MVCYNVVCRRKYPELKPELRDKAAADCIGLTGAPAEYDSRPAALFPGVTAGESGELSDGDPDGAAGGASIFRDVMFLMNTRTGRISRRLKSISDERKRKW